MGAHFHYDTAISATSQHASSWVPFKFPDDEVVAKNEIDDLPYAAGAEDRVLQTDQQIF